MINHSRPIKIYVKLFPVVLSIWSKRHRRSWSVFKMSLSFIWLVALLKSSCQLRIKLYRADRYCHWLRYSVNSLMWLCPKCLSILILELIFSRLFLCLHWPWCLPSFSFHGPPLLNVWQSWSILQQKYFLGDHDIYSYSLKNCLKISISSSYVIFSTIDALPFIYTPFLSYLLKWCVFLFNWLFNLF